jgi:sugar/nucleoside kinase (ribokinase family)
LDQGVEILVANEEEGEEFASSNNEEVMLNKLAEFSKIAVLKLGSKGVQIQEDKNVVIVKSTPVKALATTGAGDSWMAGFLAGLLKGGTLKSAGEFGNKVGAEMVQVLGAGLSKAAWMDLKKEM